MSKETQLLINEFKETKFCRIRETERHVPAVEFSKIGCFRITLRTLIYEPMTWSEDHFKVCCKTAPKATSNDGTAALICLSYSEEDW